MTSYISGFPVCGRSPDAKQLPGRKAATSDSLPYASEGHRLRGEWAHFRHASKQTAGNCINLDFSLPPQHPDSALGMLETDINTLYLCNRKYVVTALKGVN
jgi:hypothetical protein